MWATAIACTLIFTAPGVAANDSSGRCLVPPVPIQDWRPAVVELRAWPLEGRPGSELVIQKPARTAGERDTLAFERTDEPWTVCVEIVRWNGLRPCGRVCLPVGNWPVDVERGWVPPLPAARPDSLVRVGYRAPEGWALVDVTGRRFKVAGRPGILWELWEGRRRGGRGSRRLVVVR